MPWKEILTNSAAFGLILGLVNVLTLWLLFFWIYLGWLGIPVFILTIATYLVIMVLPFVRVHHRADRYRRSSGILTAMLANLIGYAFTALIFTTLRGLPR